MFADLISSFFSPITLSKGEFPRVVAFFPVFLLSVIPVLWVQTAPHCSFSSLVQIGGKDL